MSDEATVEYCFAYDNELLDMSYFEKMMVIADADNDGKNNLVVSTRGDNQSENIESQHLGNVFMYTVNNDSTISNELIVNLNEEYGESSWIDVGDVDNDGLNEIVLATGMGDRTKLGKSYLIIVKKQSN